MVIWKPNNNKWRHYQKQWQNLDLRETKQIIYYLKGIDKSYPKIYFLLNLSHSVKSYGHFCHILALFKMSIHQIWSCHVTQKCKFQKFIIFFPILHLMLGKVTKLLVEKLSTSEVISQKPHGGSGNPPSVPLGLNRDQ